MIKRVAPRYKTVFSPLCVFLIAVLGVALSAPIAAQEEPAQEEADGSRQVDGTVAEDIRTASFYELSRWLERLELPTRGSRRDLEKRLFEHYGLEYEEPARGEGGREIIIESAQESRYFELDEIDQRYIRLRGGVTLRMEDPDEGATHTISAEELVFNRDTESLTARGDIEYVIDRGTSSERFTGERLTIYLDDWDGVFLEGTSTREREISGRELEFRYSGDYITRSPDDIVTLEDGVITSSQGEPPYYRIRAKKIWVLGPGEWGLRGASLYVGRVPLMYLPFFFRPGDKLFFNPVVGAKDREGGFLQTTTYVVGQKDPDEAQVSVLQLAEGETGNLVRERDGLFMRPAEDPEEAEPEEDTLKVLADVYTTLGAYVGLQADYQDLAFADNLEADVGIGVSKNIYDRGGLLYTDRFVEEDGSTSVSWNTTEIAGVMLPFRYNLSLDGDINRGGLSLDTTLEWFSDPFVLQDFGKRAESMDWLSLVDPEEQGEEPTGREQSDLDWRAVFGYRADVEDLSPYVGRLSVDRLEVSARWLSRELSESDLEAQVLEADRSPESEFYFPESLVLPAVDLTATGTLAEGEAGRRSDRSHRDSDEDENAEEDEGADSESGGEGDGSHEESAGGEPPLPKPPWNGSQNGDSRGSSPSDGEFRPPEIRGDLEGLLARAPLSYEVGYSFRPTLRVDNEYRDRPWTTPEDVNFEFEYSSVTTNNRLSSNYLFGFYGRLFELDGRIRADGKYRTLYNEWDPEDQTIERLRADSYDYSSVSVAHDFTSRTYPFQDNLYVGDSNLSYTLDATYYRRAYAGDEAFDDPEYDDYFFDWTDEYISSHNLAGDLRVDYWGATQSLKIVGNLPPIDNTYDGTLTLRTGPLTSQVQTSAAREDDLWELDPLRVTETLEMGDNVRLREALVYDIERDRLRSSRTGTKLWWLTADYSAEYTTGYNFNEATRRFEETSGEAFRPVEAAVGIDADYETEPFWKRRTTVGFRFDSDLRMDLQRFNQSSLDVRFGMNARVHEFLDLSVSSTSSNGVVYRYVDDLAEQVGVEPKNPFTDLARSFNFFNIDDRRESDFNLSRIDVEATHYLGDWVLNVQYSGFPEQTPGDDGRDRFEWQREFSIFLEWMPIPEFNSEIDVTDEEGVTYGRR